ncbi:pyridoxamine 5'-phosphate oxidase family protein [Streptomyces odonnellii]|uniref:pyridoxamine 5'-phosphate oxidase family protein n=1 Tax=Streptomyces odonnellii TaxID=1417980 RepID=UPI0006250B0B|nr:pyridoxamine 5'-phosphate oxidase family protein [Streptomyces odonnellii]
MALTREEREQFLAEPHIGALAVNATDGQAPLTVPIWYQYRPGGELWIITGSTSRKGRLIEAAGRFSLLADRAEPTVRYVSVEGPVTSTEPATRDHVQEMSARYVAADKVDSYVEFALREHRDQVVMRMRPERWFSTDLGRF